MAPRRAAHLEVRAASHLPRRHPKLRERENAAALPRDSCWLLARLGAVTTVLPASPVLPAPPHPPLRSIASRRTPAWELSRCEANRLASAPYRIGGPGSQRPARSHVFTELDRGRRGNRLRVCSRFLLRRGRSCRGSTRWM